MARLRHLARAPIQEALIDFRVSLVPGFQVHELERAKKDLAHSYPIVDQQYFLQSVLDVKERTVSPPASGIRGYLFKSTDGRSIVQFRSDGFTFNRLPPYRSWEEMLAEALPNWNLYAAIARPLSVTRIGVRFINRLQYPEGHLDLAHVLENCPQRPAGAPGLVTALLTRISTHDADSNISVNLIISVETSMSSPGPAVLIDVDAYRATAVPPSSEELVQALESLRVVKNDVFFGSITEATATRYE